MAEKTIEDISGKKNLLSTINTPEDLRHLDVADLPQVCREIRELIITDISKNPGHFASSMGAVEIIVALHYVFNTPYDRLVWDVGHQAYAHKILTGRKEAFAKIRTSEGPSGFPSPRESEYDTFVCGHAGNSISAALGMAIADRNNPANKDRKTVAVIGDASIGCGLSFEGLNNASNNPNDLLIILNDNDMSIDDNVGALHAYLSELTTSETYNKWRYRLYNFFKKKGVMTEAKRGRLQRFLNSLKSFISRKQNIFEGLNIRYFGPFDGHDVGKVVKVLGEIKDMRGPRILHLCTTKGKGFPEAEKDPSTWHAPGKFDPETGERKKKPASETLPKWQEIFGETLVELADTHPEVSGITAAMPSGTSMNLMLEKYPLRTFDVGISEGHAVTFAGGLAAAGQRPFVAIYSSFLQRAYDNIIHDVAIQGLPVFFAIDRAGIVGEDGVTHHGLFDMAYLRVIPNLLVASPMDEETLRNLMFTSLSLSSPMAVRYPRGSAFTRDWKTPFRSIESGKGRCISHPENAKVALLSIGPLGKEVTEIAKSLLEKESLEFAHYDMIWLKPLDEEILKRVADNEMTIITLEDGTINGGLYSAVNEWLSAHGRKNKVVPLGVPDRWVHHGTVKELREKCGYYREDIMNALRKEIKLSSAKTSEGEEN